jgi:enamine deaminase RidA (YjgF/YER057c/UK114 family)
MCRGSSGQLPWKDGAILLPGKLGVNVNDEQGYEVARQCAINALAQLQQATGDLDRIARILRLEGYVHCGPGYRNHPKVLNGASDLFNEVFGRRGQHTRLALGIHEMPLDAAVQLTVYAEIEQPAAEEQPNVT